MTYKDKIKVRQFVKDVCNAELCELGGDQTDDCNGCSYSGDYHFVEGECIRRA